MKPQFAIRNAEAWLRKTTHQTSSANYHHRFAKFPEVLALLTEINQLAVTEEIQLTGLGSIYFGDELDNSVACGQTRIIRNQKVRTVVNPFCSLWLTSRQLLNFFHHYDFLNTEKNRFFVSVRFLDRYMLQHLLEIPFFQEQLDEIEKEAVMSNSNSSHLVLSEVKTFANATVFGETQAIRRVVTSYWPTELEFPEENVDVTDFFPMKTDFQTAQRRLRHPELGIGYYQLVLCEDLYSDGRETRSALQINQEFFSKILEILREVE